MMGEFFGGFNRLISEADMAKRARVVTTCQTKSGRNTRFRDNSTGAKMSRTSFVKAIEQGRYDKYHVRRINGLKTPVSNPNRRKYDNLG